MALRMVVLRSRLDKAKAELEALRAKDAGFATREAELEAAFNEMTAETPEEDRAAAEQQVEDLEAEKSAHEQEKGRLQSEIERIEGEMQEEEKRTNKGIPTPEHKAERKAEGYMESRTKFYGMTLQERDAFFAREDVHNFLGSVRTCISEKRALTNVGLTIPEVMLGLLKEKVEQTSKLIGRVNLRRVGGTARQRIMGEIPEAVWTEMCAKLNELSLGFNDIEVDGYKVGGYFAVCNAILEDNDVNLASEIINALGKAIGKALDKAILYGTGTKMPMGIVTRLAQTMKPSDYPATARTWTDLHTSNVLTGTGKTGVALFQEIVSNANAIKNSYSDSGLIWVMNKKTHNKLIVQSMDKNMSAAIVAGINNAMPVIGGDIVELSFIPDDNIICGYFDMYLLAERAGTNLGQSEHYRFLEDQTVFRGTARYDGAPVIPEAFAVMSLSSTAPATTVSFPNDAVNTVESSS